LTNAVKHGQAVTVSLFLQAWPDRYELIILDDGRGADPIVKGFGLTNMEERVSALGGTLRTQSDSSGFGVYIAVPKPGDA
ncbi:MAG: histidine kinase, partial [Clostridiales bacterium]|nr:histidine kinase [Clostridiales bacterium]